MRWVCELAQCYSIAVGDGKVHPLVALEAGSGAFGDARRIEPEREGLALVRAHAEAEAAELVCRPARKIVVAARRVGENERAGAPVAAEARAEIRTVTFERDAAAQVVRGFALVVAAHAVRPTHAELLPGDEQVVGLLGIRGDAQDEIRRQHLRERDTRAPDRIARPGAHALGGSDGVSAAVHRSAESVLIAV